MLNMSVNMQVMLRTFNEIDIVVTILGNSSVSICNVDF